MGRAKSRTGNLFNATDRQAEAMDLMVKHGSSKLVADLMRTAPNNVDRLIAGAAGRIGCNTRLQALLAWDRARRAPIRPQAPSSVFALADALGFVGEAA
jgi:DNA-binding CsgD family transcriptional regulator